jgi:hypothetical protein
MFKNIGKGLLRTFGRTGLRIQKYSPEIFVVVGIAGVITSTVMACRATLKAEKILNYYNDQKNNIKFAKEQAEKEQEVLYTEEDQKRDLIKLYTQTSVDFIKLYGPSVMLGIASIGCIIGSHRILKRRNIALMAAYKVLQESFQAYRKRIIETYGEEIDYMYRHGLRANVVTENEIDENGKVKKVKKMKLSSDYSAGNNVSMYARFFDEGSNMWSSTPEYNLVFLKAQQNYFNDMLKARGHVFLNEVYDALGIPRSQAGSIVGWVAGNGDNYIDFGIFGGERRRTRDFVNGNEASILLDFNVDGVIYDLI